MFTGQVETGRWGEALGARGDTRLKAQALVDGGF